MQASLVFVLVSWPADAQGFSTTFNSLKSQRRTTGAAYAADLSLTSIRSEHFKGLTFLWSQSGFAF